MRPLPVGTKVLVEAEVVQIGKRLVSVRGIMKDEQGKVAVMCEHLKVSIDPEAGGEPPKVGGRL